MGFLDKLFGSKKEEPKTRPAPRRAYPSRSIINDPDLRSLADCRRYYPLPDGFDYRDRGNNDVVVVRKSDGQEFVFLAEEGILAFDIPKQRQDGSWGKRTTEVLKVGGSGPHIVPPTSSTQFPQGKNIISDPDVKTAADLKRFYPLPSGFEYRVVEEGELAITRLSDGAQFSFLIEEELLTFDEPYTKKSGKTAYKTTEVFKRA